MFAAVLRYFYTFLYWLILPGILVRLLQRSVTQPDYRKRIGERLGYYPQKLEKCLWIHAVSVGESLAALPLIKALKASYPHYPILVTTTTPTGAARIQAALGNQVLHAYLPYDLPRFMRRFLRAMQPRLGIIMETEWWPNLLQACQQQHVPIYLFNARLSEKSANGYQRIAPLTRRMLSQFSWIAAQSQADAARLLALGANPNTLSITGNIKFDIQLPSDLTQQSNALRDSLGKERLIWIAASTHEGEEVIVLNTHRLICQQIPNALLILVPRHPNRFAAVAQLSQTMFVTARRSQQAAVTPETHVYLADTMGEMLLFYSVADIAFVGGSLKPIGGHNMLEPAALAKPIITGPHLNNFVEISELLMSANAQVIIYDAEPLAREVIGLMKNAEKRTIMGQCGLAVVEKNRGALKKQLAVVKEIMSQP